MPVTNTRKIFPEPHKKGVKFEDTVTIWFIAKGSGHFKLGRRKNG
jgi:hypothetical protein